MTCRRVPLSPGRQHIGDLAWLSRRVPRCIVRAQIEVPRLLAARSALPAPRPAWPMLFAKAFAMAAADRPVLRRIHAMLPTPRLLEVPRAIGCILIERHDQGEAIVMAERFLDLPGTPLPILGALLTAAKNSPVWNHRPTYRLLRLLRLPWPLRRLLLLWGLATARPMLRYGGTFAVSSVGGQGASIVDSISPLPVFLAFGPIDDAGRVEVFMAFDHRVMDGIAAAEALQALQAMLEGALAAEVEALLSPAG
jgi:hypothetical protein